MLLVHTVHHKGISNLIKEIMQIQIGGYLLIVDHDFNAVNLTEIIMYHIFHEFQEGVVDHDQLKAQLGFHPIRFLGVSRVKLRDIIFGMGFTLVKGFKFGRNEYFDLFQRSKNLFPRGSDLLRLIIDK
jgi:hypothetical protein